MDHHIARIDQHPIAGGLAFRTNVLTGLFQLAQQMVGQRANMTL